MMAEKPKKILAIIPARSGSKGIINKNTRLFVGKPLIVHSIETAKSAPSVHRVVVSTDSPSIAHVAESAGAENPVMRPPELAGDASPVVDAVIHLLDFLREHEQYEPTHVLLLQPTSPLRNVDDIENAINLFLEKDADSLVSVCRTENLLFTIGDDRVLSMTNPGVLSSSNRQELPRYYKLDGSMIYLIKTDVLRKERSFLAGRLVGYEIFRWRAVDLDEPQDFVVGELLYKSRKQIEKDIRDFK